MENVDCRANVNDDKSQNRESENSIQFEEASSESKSTTLQHSARCLSSQAMQLLYDLKENNQLCDAVLHLEDGGKFNIHRAILSACSNYFRTMFTTALNSEDRKVFELRCISSKVMNLVLKYAYLRTIDITHDNVCELLRAADYLGITGIQELCCGYLRANLSPLNCFSIMKFARKHFCESLERDARRYVLRNFVQVTKENTDILGLPIDELTELIGEDELNVQNEETAWELALRWIDQEPGSRKAHIVDLMKNIRLGLLDTQYFLEKVKDHPYVVGNRACRPIIIETLKFLYDVEMISQKDSEVPIPVIARPRVPHEVLFAIGGWSGNAAINFIETYDTRADRWVKVKEVDPAGPRAYHGTAVIGFHIYVIGGFDAKDYFNSCRCFDAISKTWREIAPMNSRRSYVSVAVLDDVVYAMGGFDGYYRQKTAEKYDYKRNQWSLIAPMNLPRSDASATTLDGLIYIIGGFNGRECVNTAEVYDPATNTWTLLPPMRSRRSGVSAIAYHGHVYAIGGFNGIVRMSCGEKYNPQTQSWIRIPKMYMPRSNFAVEIIDDMIFAMGGYNGVTTSHQVECYDEKTNEWYEATNMNRNRSGLSACIVKILPNVYDYIDKYRERLREEKRQKSFALEAQEIQRQQQNAGYLSINRGSNNGNNNNNDSTDNNNNNENRNNNCNNAMNNRSHPLQQSLHFQNQPRQNQARF